MLISSLRASRGAVRSLVIATRCMSSSDVESAALDTIKENPAYFRNIPVENITFMVGAHFVSGEPSPQAYVGNSDRPGIPHLTPISLTLFPRFSMVGTFGTTKVFSSGTKPVDDYPDAELELTLGNPAQGALQQEYVDYIAWLRELQGRYLEHLTTCVSSYPSLKRKFSFVLNKPEVLKEMIIATAGGVSRLAKDDKGEPVAGSDMVPFRQKIYYKREGAKLSGAKTRCALDEEMKARGFVRNHVPLFDSKGAEIPIEEAKLFHNDLVTVQNTLACNLYDVAGNVGFNLKRTLNSVVLIRRANRGNKSSSSGPASPFVMK